MFHHLLVRDTTKFFIVLNSLDTHFLFLLHDMCLDYIIPIFNTSTNTSVMQMLTGSELFLFCEVVETIGYFILVLIYIILALGSCA